jgi:two-component system response regulator HydG
MRKDSASTQGKCGNILLVDDHKLGLAARKTILEELGYNVETATNGQAAYELIHARHFDLLITDIGMPKMNGLELISKLREEQYAIPIILLTAMADAVGEEDCSRAGADLLLRKSANEVTQMVTSVKRFLERKPQRKPVKKEETTSVNGRVKTMPRGKRKTS